MASTRRKSAAIALAVVGIAGLSLASAAQLTVNSSTLQAGTTTVATCDADGVTVGYTNAFSTGQYRTTAVAVSGINALCDTGTIKLILTKTDGTVLGTEVSGTIPVGGTFTSAAFATPVLTSDIANVAVIITK